MATIETCTPCPGRTVDRLALAAGLLLPIAVAAVLVPIRHSFPNSAAALVMVVAVVAVAANGPRAAGILSAVSAAVWFDFFLTRPYQRFTITGRADIETTVLLLLVGAAVTELAVRGRRHHRIAETDAAYLSAIGATTDLVASTAPPPAVIDQISAQLTDLLGLRRCRFQRTTVGDLPRLEADGRLHIGAGDWDLDEYGMPGLDIEILAICRGTTYGRFVLDPRRGTLSPLGARQVAIILVNQAAVALANQNLTHAGQSR